jgi:hypothetical protein
LAAADNLVIPAGYKAFSTAVRGGFSLYEQEDGDEVMLVFVGKLTFEARGKGILTPHTALIPFLVDDSVVDELTNMPIAVETQQARDFAITVDVTCTRTEAALDQWRNDTHMAIMTAYAKVFGDYQDKRAAQNFPDSGQKPLALQLLFCFEVRALGGGLVSSTPE